MQYKKGDIVAVVGQVVEYENGKVRVRVTDDPNEETSVDAPLSLVRLLERTLSEGDKVLWKGNPCTFRRWEARGIVSLRRDDMPEDHLEAYVFAKKSDVIHTNREDVVKFAPIDKSATGSETGREIVENSTCPVGEQSEEALEVRPFLDDREVHTPQSDEVEMAGKLVPGDDFHQDEQPENEIEDKAPVPGTEEVAGPPEAQNVESETEITPTEPAAEAETVSEVDASSEAASDSTSETVEEVADVDSVIDPAIDAGSNEVRAEPEDVQPEEDASEPGEVPAAPAKETDPELESRLQALRGATLGHLTGGAEESAPSPKVAKKDILDQIDALRTSIKGNAGEPVS